MRWLVTGGCGFVGRNLIRHLRGNGEIVVLDDLSTSSEDELQQAVGKHACRVLVGDVRDAEFALHAGEGVDTVVHLAANAGVPRSVADPVFDFSVNAQGTLNLLESCRRNGIKRFVFASSSAPIGDCEPPVHEELAPHPLSPYGASKLAGEAYCSAYKHSYQIDTVALRFSNCYGPFSSHKQSVVAKFIREALEGRPWEIYGDGSQTRDFIYIDDIVDAIIRSALAEGVGGETFQIATNSETTVNELAQQLRVALEKHDVQAPALKHSEPRVADIKRSFSDVRKAHKMLGWSAKTNLPQGLEKTVVWFLGKQPVLQ